MPVTQLQRALLGSPGLLLPDEDHKEPEEGTDLQRSHTSSLHW